MDPETEAAVARVEKEAGSHAAWALANWLSFSERKRHRTIAADLRLLLTERQAYREKVEALERERDEAWDALIRGAERADNEAENEIEEARQASAEGDEKSDREHCALANRFTRIGNAMQPALARALQARRAARDFLAKVKGVAS
jgi:hypothetical protein